MSTDRPQPLPQATASELSAAPAQVSRRRALLKGVGKGAAVLAAAVPIKSLATTTVTADKHLCSVSGSMSGVRSVTTGMVTCGGRKFSLYKPVGSWPIDGMSQEVVNNGTSNFLRSTTNFGAVFGNGLTGAAYTMATMFGAGVSDATAIDEAHWIVALLNAKNYPATFPYTPAEILAQYAAGGATRLNALTFYKTHMELL